MKSARRKGSQHFCGLNRLIRCWRLSIPRFSIHSGSGSSVLIGLGSSLGDRALYLRKALLWMAHDPYMNLVCTSSVWQTTPIGAAKNAFYNMCAVIDTTYSPEELMHRLMYFEKRCNRLRGIHWMDRTLDLDVLLYGHKVVDTSIIQVPHPRMLERSFVMQPAVEIAGDCFHPTIHTKLENYPIHLDPGMWKVGVFSIAYKNRMQ